MKKPVEFDLGFHDFTPHPMPPPPMPSPLSRDETLARFEVRWANIERALAQIDKRLGEIEAAIKPIDTTSFTSYIRSYPWATY